ncbi:MAG TPA: serine hydrolase [Steroidobacteraceae bacterium]|jgi:beta-lactamase class A
MPINTYDVKRVPDNPRQDGVCGPRGLASTPKRRSRLATFVASCVFVLGAWRIEGCQAAQDPKLAAVIPTIQNAIQKSGADVGLAFATLDGKSEWFYRADQPYHAASTMKVPVMIELFHQRSQGKLKLEDPLRVNNEFPSLADGSIYTLDPKDDSETELYGAIGQTRTLGQLCELMITVSSNLATNLLIERLGIDNIRSTVHSLHADGMNVLRGVEDGKAFELGLVNTTTARGLLQLFDALARGKAVDQESSQEMLGILERQSFNDGIPAGVPAGTRVAHKTGEITQIHHDAGIVFATRPFVLVILVHGLSDTKDSAALMATITRQLYQATQ